MFCQGVQFIICFPAFACCSHLSICVINSCYFHLCPLCCFPNTYFCCSSILVSTEPSASGWAMLTRPVQSLPFLDQTSMCSCINPNNAKNIHLPMAFHVFLSSRAHIRHAAAPGTLVELLLCLGAQALFLRLRMRTPHGRVRPMHLGVDLEKKRLCVVQGRWTWNTLDIVG